MNDIQQALTTLGPERVQQALVAFDDGNARGDWDRCFLARAYGAPGELYQHLLDARQPYLAAIRQAIADGTELPLPRRVEDDFAVAGEQLGLTEEAVGRIARMFDLWPVTLREAVDAYLAGYQYRATEHVSQPSESLEMAVTAG